MTRRLAAVAAVLLLAASPVAADTALVDAVRAGDRAAAMQLLEAGADADASRGDGTTALIWAAHHGDSRLVRALLDAGADANAQNAFGASPMSEAAIIGSDAVIALLLDAGADPDSPGPEGESALMLVARTGNVAAASLLLDAGADVNATERWGGQSALMWAAAQLQPDMVALLLEHGADTGARGAVREWTRKITAEPRPKDMHAGGFTPLLYAARGGCLACVTHLLDAGADPDVGDPVGVTPLIMATINYHYDVAAYLIERGADVGRWDLYGRTPLYAAIDMNTLPLPRRPDVSPSVRPLELAERLLAAGAYPDAQLKQWRPPFRDAIMERGGDNTLTTGATPLLRAAHASDVPAIELLLAHGATVDLPNATGITPLMAAAGVGISQLTHRAAAKSEEDSLAAVRLLLDAGADIHARTDDVRRLNRDPHSRRQVEFPATYRFADVPRNGTGMLHGPARMGWNRMVRLLVERGAQIGIADVDGVSPWHLAMAEYEPAQTVPPPDPHEETAELLLTLCAEQAGCDPAALRERGGAELARR